MHGTDRKFGLVLLWISILVAPAIAGTHPAPATHTDRPNVIFITVDTLRADHIGCYGARQVKTPTIDALARDGVLFERAISQVPLTWPSHAAMLTGTYPFQNGVQDFTGHPLSDQFRSVAQAFKDTGYATGAVVSSFVLDRSWGLARGFDYYDDAFSAETFKKDIALADRRANESVSQALVWLNKSSKRPFFLWLHLYDPHSPYDPPEPYRTAYKDHLYDGEIAYADRELGRLTAWLRTNHLYDSSLIVFASDHGESLGDHGESEHGFFIYNSTTRIPLIVKPPASAHIRPERVQRPVQSISIPSSLLVLTGIHDRIQTQFQARSLLSSAAADQPAYSETFYPFSSFGWSPLHAVETSQYHYIDAPQPELYDVLVDPDETKNLASEEPAIVSVLKQKLQERLSNRPFKISSPPFGGLSQDAADKLRALGYVASQSSVSAEALAKGLADPKEKLSEYNSFLKASDALRVGDYAAAERLLNEIAEHDPQVSVVPFMLGQAAIRQQKWDRAVSFMEQALKLNPKFGEAMTALAHAFYAQGEADEAAQWLRKAVDLNPENYRAWYEFAHVLARMDRAGARTAYEKTVSIQPNFAPGQRDFGVFELEEKHFPAALNHFQRARSLGEEDARLLNFMGICYTEMNQPVKAAENLRRAVTLDPSLAEAHLNLGYFYQRSHQDKAAANEYATACRLEKRFCKVASTTPD